MALTSFEPPSPIPMKLFFQEYGTGQPLIILHGLLGSLDNWHTLSKTFATAFRVLAVDLRNHGRSPHSNKFTYSAMAEDVLELMDAQHIGSAHLLGHSMGGKVAMQLAVSYPERVDKLIVVDIAPRAYPRIHGEILEALISLNLTGLQSRQQVEDELARNIPDLALQQFLMKNLTRDPSGAFSWKANLDVISRNYEEIAREISATRSFSKPTLFVKGDRSDYVLASDISFIHRLFPSAAVSSIDAGHWIHAESPNCFADVVLNFLGSPAT